MRDKAKENKAECLPLFPFTGDLPFGFVIALGSHTQFLNFGVKLWGHILYYDVFSCALIRRLIVA